MREREPNEVSAALRDAVEVLGLYGEDQLVANTGKYPGNYMYEAADAIDRLTLDLAQARRERDDVIVWRNDYAAKLKAEEERADTAERELSEARAALAKAGGERDTQSRGRLLAEHERNQYTERAKAAESSLREHAEAIVALREALEPIARDAHLYDHCEIRKLISEALAAPISALASRLSAERRAERDVVRAAREWATEDQKEADGERSHIGGASTALRDALAALPASPPFGVIDK